MDPALLQLILELALILGNGLESILATAGREPTPEQLDAIDKARKLQLQIAEMLKAPGSGNAVVN